MAAGGSVGTVTSVSVVTANGISGSVATATSTPAITLTLGSITPSAVQISGLTASEIVGTDASKNLVSLAVATYPSLTELAYVKGVTSAIQTQLNAKVDEVASTDNAIARFDGTGGAIQDSGLILDDSNNLTGPSAGFKITGGTSTTADLTLQTTSGVGATGADMHFLVGNNGATEAMTILNSGNVGIGTTAPSTKLHVTGTIKTGLTGTAGRLEFARSSDGLSVGALYASGSSLNVDSPGGDVNFLPGSVQQMVIKVGGNVGIGITSPTAVLHLKAGTATANTAPIKLAAGVVNTTPEAGTIEFDGTDFFLTV